MHTHAMDEIRASRDVWRATRPHTKEERCAVASRIARRYAQQAADKVGVTIGDLNGAAKSAAAKQGCGIGTDFASTSKSMSPRGSGLLSIFGSLTMTEVVTGEFGNYVGGLNDAYSGASSPDDVASASWAIVNQAAANGLGQPDLEVLAALADIGASSASEWYSFQQGGGFDDPHQDEFSLFRLGAFSWRIVGWSDLGGAVAGAYGGMAGGPAGAFAGAVVGGAISSAVAALAQF